MKNTLSGVLAAAGAALALAQPAWGQAGDPLRDPAVLRVREAFKVDGIALFDPHKDHAARMGVCAASIFAGLKWCVSGTAEETRGAATYVKTTGYNIDGEGRIVYAVSTRRGYPLTRDEFDTVVLGISERLGAGAAIYALRKKGEDGEVNSLIAVWGGLRLVHLTESEYATVEAGNSLKRGHLVDHRFNLVASARQRDPVYKVEGDAGYIIHFMVAGPDRADIVTRIVYPPAFVAAPPKAPDGAAHPLAEETARPSAPASADAPPVQDQAKRAAAERALAAERLLHEEAERKAAEERAARAEAERKLAAERKAAEELRKELEEERKAAAELRQRLDEERKAAEERARRSEAEKGAEERAKKAEAERKAGEARRAREESERRARERAEAERKAEAERAAEAERRAAERRAAAERQAAEEARRAEVERRRDTEAERGAERPAEAERSGRERVARPAEWYRLAADAAKRAGAIWTISETQDRLADERTLRAQSIFGSANGLAVEVSFECTIGRERRLIATARGFDRKSGSGVAFRTEGEGSFGVRARFRLDEQAPQEGLLFRDRQDDIASIVELLMTPADLEKNTPRAGIWLRHRAALIEFNLAGGSVSATIAPYAENLRRVLEACAE